MGTINEILLQYGYVGMGLAAFLAGTFVPFNSEILLAALLAASTMNPVMTVAAATVGNVAGSMVNYYIGRMADPDKLAASMKIKPQRLERATRWVQRYGAWTGMFTFLPILGSVIAIALGLLRVNAGAVLLATTVGKLGRYIIVAWPVVAALR